MWQLLTIDENQLKQLKIVEALLKEQKVIPQETIEKVLAKPFFTSGCIDKDKEPSALNV